jgi:hypothetical protein
VKHNRQIESLYKLLLIIGLYVFVLGFSQVSYGERSSHHYHFVSKIKDKSKSKTTIIKSQYHPLKAKTPLPAHKKCSTTHFSAIYPLYQFNSLGYSATTYHFSILTLVAKIQTTYCLAAYYQRSKSLYSLRAPPAMA